MSHNLTKVFACTALLLAAPVFAASSPAPAARPAAPAAKPAAKSSWLSFGNKAAAKPAAAPAPRTAARPANGRMVQARLANGKTVTYNCSLPGNQAKQVCKH